MVLAYVLIFIGLVFLFAGLYFTRPPKAHGKIIIRQQEDKKVISLEIDIDPDEIKNMSVVIFKVEKEVIAD